MRKVKYNVYGNFSEVGCPVNERPGGDTASRSRLQAKKHEAITRAARVVFGRDGYSRSSIEAIAAEAGVSTRTIYNHFASKEQLFSSVLAASATSVADAFIETVSLGNADVGDARQRLVLLGWALASQAQDFPEHFAMVRQINLEAGHFSAAILTAWQAAGPHRVQHEIGRQLQSLADHGLLRISNRTRATKHFIALVGSEITDATSTAEAPLDRTAIAEYVYAAVETFLHGYAVTSGTTPVPMGNAGRLTAGEANSSG